MNTRTNHGAILPIGRIELLPFTLPTPPPEMKWHHEDGWNDGDLPRGTRPFIEGEKPQKGDFCIADGESVWQGSINWWSDLHASSVCRYRTTRPLLFTYSGNEWTWHRAGDPMLCDVKRKVALLRTTEELPAVKGENWFWLDDSIIGWRYADEKPDDSPPWTEWHGGPCPLKDEEVEEWDIKYRTNLVENKADAPSSYEWCHNGSFSDINSYRVLKWREKKPKVPLGRDDVPPGSVIKTMEVIQAQILRINKEAVFILGSRGTPYEVTFEELQDGWQINRSIPMTGKWDANAWEACEK